MKILTIDTSLDKMYVTIAEDGEILRSKVVESTKERYHSALLFPTIIEFLNELSLNMKNIEAIGVNVGPGSFTGIRASLTVARTIAQNLKIRAVGVPSLEILSFINNSSKNAAVLLDARKGKAYFGVYTHEGEVVVNPQTLEYEKVFEYIKNNDVFVISDRALNTKLAAEGLNSLIFEDQKYNFGETLVKLTFKRLNNDNEDFGWYRLKPLYIQPPPISMPKKVH